MKILIDINHPAHVHFFKTLYFKLKQKGHDVIVTASLKEINYELLRKLNINFIDLGTYGNTPLQKMLNVPVMALKMSSVVRKHKPDILMGIASSRICHGTLFSRKRKTWVFTDTEHAKEQILLFKPFATAILTPDCFLNNLGKKQISYPSYHELAYLHPNVFKPDYSILNELGVEKDEKYFLLRFVSWAASHDIGQKGLSIEQKIELVKKLSNYGKVFISDEGNLPNELKQYQLKADVSRMHHILNFATMYIGEGGTMASEAAVLGTPSIFISSLTAGTFQELESKYELMFAFKDYNNAKSKINSFLEIKDLKSQWQQKREKLLKDKVDFNKWMIDFFEKEMNLNLIK
jgi:predicted glycosyltransferase